MNRGAFNFFGGLLPGAAVAVLAVATIAVTIWWQAALHAAADSAPRFSRLESVSLKLPAGKEAILGRAELLQPSGTRAAELRHVRLHATQDGKLLISRVSEVRRLNIEFAGEGGEGPSEWYEIDRSPDAVTRLETGAQSVDIAVTDNGAITVTTAPAGSLGGSEILPGGELILPDGSAAGACAEIGMDGRAFQWLSVIARKWSSKGVDTVAVLGGGMNCLHQGRAHIALPRADSGVEFAIQKNRPDGRLFIGYRDTGLAPVRLSTIKSGSVVRQHAGTTGMEWIVAAASPVSQPLVTHFTAGRTRYAIEATSSEAGSWSIDIRPVARIPLFIAKACSGSQTMPSVAEECPPRLETSPNTLDQGVLLNVKSMVLPGALQRLFVDEGQGLTGSERGIRFGLIIASAAALFGAGVARQPSKSRRAILGLLAFSALLFALAPLILAFPAMPVSTEFRTALIVYAFGLLWIATTLILAMDRAGGWRLLAFWLIITVIAAIGSISLFTLSADGPNTDWERFFIKHKLAVLDLLPLLTATVALMNPVALRRRLGADFAGRPSWASPLGLLIGAVALGFLAWLVFGDQQGISGSFQPVEAGKFAVAVVLGVVLAQWAIRSRRMGPSWHGLTPTAVIGALIFLGALAIVPVVRSDMSPLIIVALMLASVGLVGAMMIGMRIRQDIKANSAYLSTLPMTFVPAMRDRSGPTRVFSIVFIIAAGFGAYAAYRGDTILALCAGAVLVAATITFVKGKRSQGALAGLAIAAAILAGPAAYGVGDLPVRWGLGADGWSWSAQPEDQLNELRPSRFEVGRTLLVERVLAWADMRYVFTDASGAPRNISLQERDIDFHVMRSRAVIARAPCGVSREFSAGPYFTGSFVAWFGQLATHYMDGSCGPLPGDGVASSCAPANLKAAVRPHCVPVIQSDFAATYLIARHGLGAAAIFALAQVAAVFLVFGVFVRLQSRGYKNPVITGAEQAMAIIALGCGVLLVLQWVLAWSNAFGLLPVMGQPMTFLSAGVSHHLFMAITCVLAIMTAIRFAGLDEAPHRFDEPPLK